MGPYSWVYDMLPNRSMVYNITPSLSVQALPVLK
jgi:hypothetical protein